LHSRSGKFYREYEKSRGFGGSCRRGKPRFGEEPSKFLQKTRYLNFTILSDPEHEVLEKYNVWQLKKMYGKEYMGVVRSTFIINPKGYIENEWTKVRAKGHVEEVKEKLSELKR
jgi:peroxiredoxin